MNDVIKVADFGLTEDMYSSTISVPRAVQRVRMKRNSPSSGWLPRALKQTFSMKTLMW